ncbi:MAG: SIMPL domain-containing protein [Rhodothermales bacterium]
MKRYTSIFALLLMLGGLIAPATSSAQTMEKIIQRTVTVGGQGKATAVPDKATVSFGIVTRSMDPEDARARNAKTASEAMNAIRKMGVEERKLKLQTLRLQPVQEYNPETRRHEEKGYEAYRDLVVEVEDLDKLPGLIAEIVQKGANRLNNINYGLKDDAAFRNEALVEAVQEARAKAELMASTAGAKLGAVLVIQEEGYSVPAPMVMMDMAESRVLKAGMAAPEPDAYAAGEMEVSTSVRITFALQD